MDEKVWAAREECARMVEFYIEPEHPSSELLTDIAYAIRRLTCDERGHARGARNHHCCYCDGFLAYPRPKETTA